MRTSRSLLHSSNQNPYQQPIKKVKSNSFIEDQIGFVSIVDANGNSPLLLLCRYNQSISLLGCIREMLAKNHYIKRKANGDATVATGIGVNCQKRKGFNALHLVCMRYDGSKLLDIIELLVERDIDVNRTERSLDRNALQLLFQYNRKGRDLAKIAKLFLTMTMINLKHKDTNGWTALHYLCRYYTHQDNLVDLVQLLIDKGVDVGAED